MLTVPQLVKKFPHVIWNAKIHYRTQNSPPLAHILSHTNTIQSHPTC